MNPDTKNSLEAVRGVLSGTHEAALGTCENGRPFVSATGFLFEPSPEETLAAGGRIYVLLSDLARHARNLRQTPLASLLVLELTGKPVHEKKRVSLQGTVAPVKDTGKTVELKKAYLEIFPRAEIFFQLPDFRFYELEVNQVHWIGGFGKALQWP